MKRVAVKRRSAEGVRLTTTPPLISQIFTDGARCAGAEVYAPSGSMRPGMAVRLAPDADLWLEGEVIAVFPASGARERVLIALRDECAN